MELALKGQKLDEAKNAIKDPYIFEFLGVQKESILKERSLEKKLVDNIQKFLLELGKGFSFVVRQFKITIDNEHYFIDLVFYHRILKCWWQFFLNPAKIWKVEIIVITLCIQTLKRYGHFCDFNRQFKRDTVNKNHIGKI